jgi:uncharacterized membrane protein YeaQ/YmgE (transglycosylase-associated protein family)
MAKSVLIASIITATVLATFTLSYFLSASFSVAWLICAVVGAFALIAVEQS